MAGVLRTQHVTQQRTEHAFKGVYTFRKPNFSNSKANYIATNNEEDGQALQPQSTAPVLTLPTLEQF